MLCPITHTKSKFKGARGILDKVILTRPSGMVEMLVEYNNTRDPYRGRPYTVQVLHITEIGGGGGHPKNYHAFYRGA